jgi:uncharacterized membrane protein
MMSWYWGAGAWGMGLMIVAWVGFFVLVARLVGRVTRTEHTTTQNEPPRAVLDRRFAAGELTAEEYASMRRALERPTQPVE